jgi:hypothetical protein
LIVPMPVISHLFNFIHSYHRFTFASVLFLLFSVGTCECSEAPNLHLPSRHSSFGVDDNSQIRLEHSILMLELIIDVNSRKPASISRMAVVPSSHTFSSITHILSSHVVNHVLISLISCIDSSLSGFYRESKCVHN